MSGLRVLFLDRDGTINEDPGYLANPEQVRLIPGAPEALRRLRVANSPLGSGSWGPMGAAISLLSSMATRLQI